MFAFREPEQKQRDRRDQAGSGGNRKAGKVLSAIGAGFSFMIRGGGIESGQTQRTAGQINEGNDPTCVRKFVENDAINHQRWRESERNNVGERIKFASEWTFMPAQARESAIQKIENERAENKPNGRVEKIRRRICVRALQKRAFQNLERSSEAAKQISRRH